ncbi:MAG TPA: DNA-processing protein DprA [Casimicrobiaceae bacterium]|nr:DNA-processing protein DprA [Casimicrobiaceae bacterium]
MDVDARVEAWASLQLVPGLGTRACYELLKAFGGPVEVRAASRASLGRFLPADAAEALHRGPEAATLDRTLKWLAADGHWLVAWDDPNYPAALLALGDAPPVVLYAGWRELLNRPALAIVGSRNATPRGVEHAEAFAAALSDAGLTIVSGLALGIDAGAHRGGLAGTARSIAVVGTGLDSVYPRANKALAQQLARDGGLLSELPIGTPPLRGNFPRRNRLLSGLSRGVLVIEATLDSGSLITARLAAEQGRDVFAIPGSIDSPFSKGCHRLIRDGAKLVETAADVLEELGLIAPAGSASASPEPDAQGSDATSKLLRALGHDPASIDSLAGRTGLPADVVTATLVELELQGRVALLPGGVYQRSR